MATTLHPDPHLLAPSRATKPNRAPHHRSPRLRALHAADLVRLLARTHLHTPSPQGGIFATKILVFNSLRCATVCKIFITNELRAKYLVSIS